MTDEPQTDDESCSFSYPAELPISVHRDEIMALVRRHDAVIVCGDTGSGKTTQLPKMAMELGRGTNGKLIACTQPRRLAATTVAERVAKELGESVGGTIGYQHRFAKEISDKTRVKFMTDGVLLAETRHDPLLRQYDTVIVDEAHERSLNVDFLLGILKRILRKRRDLKVIVSSATLDTELFSKFFDNAPAITVPGRLHPIDIRYAGDDDPAEIDLPHAVGAALRTLPPDHDTLVFLPGERDIRETADHLGRIPEFSRDEIIPLLASIPRAEQQRAFRTSPQRRVILATNVAETSVTIPGIRAVIDSGLARLSRYIHRTQVQRLQVERISQASARQRAGRCGRVGPGTCIRLYSREDYLERDEYTPPEILRSSLAGVILTMLDLRLGNIEDFPFVEPPKPAVVREGLRELLELGAIRHEKVSSSDTNRSGKHTLSNPNSPGKHTLSNPNSPGKPTLSNPNSPGKHTLSDANRPYMTLTKTGRALARFPVEPRLARILLEASRLGALHAAIPVVAAMSCDDPRRRPMDEREQAAQAHARFRVKGSDFLGTLKLWNWWNDEAKTLSQSQLRKLAKKNYVSYPKMREWRDIAKQLTELSRRMGLYFGDENKECDDQSLHRSLMAGLLSRLGHIDPQDPTTYRGAHSLRFALHPGSVLAKEKKSRPEWIMAGELVDTSRLFARNAAVIDPAWIESAAGDLVKKSYRDPFWDAEAGFVRATEQVTLYGLVIVPSRRRDFSRIDPVKSREIFIHHALILGETNLAGVRENIKLVNEMRELSERLREPELFAVERLAAHFDEAIPKNIVSAGELKKWLYAASPQELAKFRLKRSEWIPSTTVSSDAFPPFIRLANAKISLTYRHAPDDAETDGITATVRKSNAAVLRRWRADWLVPGALPRKVGYILSSLPSAYRRALPPVSDTTAIILPLIKGRDAPLEDAIRETILKRFGIRVPFSVFTEMKLPGHLKVRFVIVSDDGKTVLASSRSIDEVLKDEPPPPPPKIVEKPLTSAMKAAVKDIEKQFRLLLWEAERLPQDIYDSIETQIAFLTYPGWERLVPPERFADYPRYIRALRTRIDRARVSPASDRSKDARIEPYWTQYVELISSKAKVADRAALVEYRWLLEEYRISLFAQEVGTRAKASPNTLSALWLKATEG